MFDAPVVIHLSRLVTDLGKRSGTRDGAEQAETEVACDEADAKGHLESSKYTPSKEKRAMQRKPIRIRRVRQTKAKAKRVREHKDASSSTSLISTRDIKRSHSQQLEKSRVDTKLGGIDPFGAFELPQDSLTDLALHHWVNVFQNTRMPINPRQPWMMINLSDKTLLSVTSYCSIAHYHFIRGQRAPPSSFPQKLNAIRNINNALRKIPSDHTMVAVAVMTILECLGGPPSEWVVHRKGLQLMICSRGGLENLGFKGAAQRTVSWADTCCAILLRTKPSLEPILIPNAGESAIPGFTVGDLEQRLLPLTSAPDLSKRILYIWLRLRYLTEFLTCIPTNNKTQIDDCFFSDKLDFIERQILFLLHSESLAESRSAAFLTAFLNASLIFVYEELREVPKWNNLCICLSQRIHSGLQLVDLDIVGAWCPDLLLWVLLLGRSGANPLEVEGKGWFLKAIGELEGEFRLQVPATVAAVAGLKYFELAEAALAKWNPGRIENGDANPTDEG